jgi:hypothetical protein
MEGESVKEHVPWIPIILLTAIATIAGSIVFPLLASSTVGALYQCIFNWGTNWSTKFTIMPFVFLLAAYPFRKLLKISSTHLTYLYAAGTIMCYSDFSYWWGAAGMSRSVLFTTGAVKDMMGMWWWNVPYDVAQATMAGGAVVNWVVWMGPILFWTTFSYSLFFFMSGLSLVFRRRWIEIENFAFPLTMAAHELVRSVDVNRPANWSLKPLLVGLLLGIIFEAPIFLQYVFPWFPDIFGWRVDMCPPGTYNPPTTSALMQNIVGLTFVSKDPVGFGLFFLAPVAVSFNVWFWSLLLMVLEQVGYQMGYYSGIFSQVACCRAISTLTNGPPFYWGYVSGIGGATAIAVTMLYNSRSYLRQTFKLALAHHSSISEEEKGEVASYRTAYLILAMGTITVILWLMSAGLSLGSALAILIFTIFISGMAGFYTYSNTGFYAVNNLRGGFSWFPVIIRWGGNLPSLNPDVIMSDFTTQLISNGSVCAVFPSGQIMPLKMASLTGTSNRNTFLVTTVAMLISIPLIQITRIWMVSMYGVVLLGGGHASCSIDNVCSGWGWTPTLMPLITYGGIGFVITFALAMLHGRFVWFPFEPLGFVIATSVPGLWYGVWSQFLVAWIVKTIVLRVGGSNLYERYGIPAVGGFLGGVALSIFIGSLVLVFRFFVPF